MSCPTCDHTMQLVVSKSATAMRDIWWCPRCGTWKDSTPCRPSVPKLVEKCREAVRLINKDHPFGRWLIEQMNKAGVLESSMTPADRPA